MNQSEWKSSNKYRGKYTFYNKTRKIQKSLQCNSDPNATVIHHLRDTEEQRKYNDEHYELWGHNLDGTFEYGKYVIFVTEEEHTEIHKCSEETRHRMRESQRIRRKNTTVSKETKRKISESNKGRPGMIGENHPMYGKHHTEESIKKIKNHLPDLSGENNPFYGRHHTEESKKKISESGKGKHSGSNNGMFGKHLSDEHRQKLSESGKGKHSGKNNGMYGRHHSEETKKKISDSRKLKNRSRSNNTVARVSESRHTVSEAYYKYKSDGSTMSWNDFQKHRKLSKENIENE